MTELSSQPQPVPAGVARLTGALREALEEGMAHQQARRPREAEAAYRRALAEHPDEPNALNLLGTLLVRRNALPEAIRHIQRAVELRPDDATFRANLCGVLQQIGRLDEALREIEAARVIAPDSREVTMNHARLLRRLGRGAEAIAQYERLLSADADFRPAAIGLGKAHAERGDAARAAETFRAAIARWPDDPAAHIELAQTMRFTTDAGEAGRMAALAANLGLGQLDRINLLHAAGKVCDDLGRHDQAFAHFAAAKALDSAPYDPQARSAAIDRLIASFTPELLTARQGIGDASARPLFIVGMPRSGAALAERVLASHPEIGAGGELDIITQLAFGLAKATGSPTQYPEAARGLTPEAARALAGRYLAALDRVSTTAARIVDRMPHNFEHLGLIALLFPNARVVHCRRDALDACLACYTRPFSEGHGYNRDLGHLGHYYREHERLMAHWKSVLPLPIFELQYEALIAEPERVSRALAQFAGVDWDQSCLGAFDAGRLRETVGRWRKYEQHLAPLRAALGR